ncbi:MAG: hypothetical protein ACREL9_04015 [Gemmatimonadales bacterium]
MRRLIPVGMLLCAGCYGYHGVGSVAPAENTDVRVDFVSPRDVTLQDVTVHGITTIQGRLLYANTDSVAVAVTRLWGQEGRTYEAERIGVSLPASGVAALRQKRLSPARSGLAMIAGSAAIVGMILGVGELVGSGGTQGPKPLP